MKSTALLAAALTATALCVPAPASAGAVVGQAAPAFTAKDTNGKTHSLADYKGRVVVLEWVNHQCPFVRKHYGSGNMQKLQAAATGKGVVWLSVNSSAAAKEGHVDAAKANALTKEKSAAPSALILDAAGTIGRAFGARTTPHMFVIDTAGVVAYAGAIDDTPSTDPNDIPTAKNYVTLALDAVLAGQRVKDASTEAYGCSVKY